MSIAHRMLNESKLLDNIGHQKQLKILLAQYLLINANLEEQTPTCPAGLFEAKEKGKRNIALAQALLSHGFCFGFTLCHAAFENIGKLAWWEDALIKMSQWKGTQEELDAKVILHQSKNPITLNDIFFRILNFITYHFVPLRVEGGVFITGLTQPKLLQPGNKFFQVDYEVEGKLLTKRVIGRACATLNLLDRKEINQLITLKFLRGNMCFIHSDTHIICISYDKAKKKWLVYDPNYKIENMHSTFSSKNKMLKELQSRLKKPMVTIDIVALGVDTSKTIAAKQLQEFKDKYNAMVDFNPMRFLQGNSILLLMKYQPKELSRIFSIIFKQGDDEKEKGVAAICAAIKIRSPKKGATNLSALIGYAHQCFKDLIQFAAEEKNEKIKKELILAIVESITQKNNAGKTGLEIMRDRSLEIPVVLSEWVKKYDQSLRKRQSTYSSPTIQRNSGFYAKPKIANTTRRPLTTYVKFKP